MAKGYFIPKCRYNKKDKKDENSNDTNNTNVVESEVRERVAMVSEMQIGMVTELNMTSVTKSIDWSYYSGLNHQTWTKSFINKGSNDVQYQFRESIGSRDYQVISYNNIMKKFV